jgi:hypothetical protein
LSGTITLAVVLVGCSTPPDSPTDRTPTTVDLPPEVKSASEVITAAGLLESTTRLSADELEGRAPGTAGDKMARAYLAERLADLGYEPFFAGGTSWDQPFEILGVSSEMPETWTFETAGGDETVSFRFRDEYMGASGVQLPEVSVENAEVVFVGYGIRAPEEEWDDFKGEDLRGKVLLMLNDDPDWSPELFAGERKLYYGRWDYKYESAARQGAAAAVIIHTTPTAGYPWEVVRNSWSGEQFQLRAGDEPRLSLQGWLTEDAALRLAEMGGHDLYALILSARSADFRPVPLGVTTSIRFDVEVRATETANTAGILRGSDPALADEVVVYTAHHDHLGVGEPDETGDTIYNGALDNGVAMAQALAVAETFAGLPESARPRRSVMFLFPAAEEQGLLGSLYFARAGEPHPGTITADINLELGNIWGRTRDVVIFGKGKSTLEDLLASVARLQEREVTAEADLHAGWYYRSDQFSLARVGVPSIWFRSGTDFIDRPEGSDADPFASWIGQHYHRPSDEVTGDWNLDGLVEDARLAFWLGWLVTTADTVPTWYPGDEFEDDRATSLAQIATE